MYTHTVSDEVITKDTCQRPYAARLPTPRQ